MQPEEQEQFEAQSELAQQQADGQQVPYAPQMLEQMQQAQAVLVEQTNPKKVVENIILRLQGKKKLPNGDEVVIAKPKMNDLGLEKISFILDSHINQNVILSFLDEKQIGYLMMELSNDLVDNLALNWKAYGISDKTDLDDINNSVLINIFAALKRAEGKNEKNFLKSMTIEQISGRPSFQKQRKEGWLSKFKL